MLLKENTTQWCFKNVQLTLSSNLFYLKPPIHPIQVHPLTALFNSNVGKFSVHHFLDSSQAFTLEGPYHKQSLYKRNTVLETRKTRGSLAINPGPLRKQRCTHNQPRFLEFKIFKELSADLPRTTWIKCPQASQSLECVVTRFYLHSETHHGHIITMVTPYKRLQKVKL